MVIPIVFSKWLLQVKYALRERFPIIGLLVDYRKKDLAPDILAGVTVGLMLIPQSIAYATLAGLHPQYGLYSAIGGGLSYALLGTVNQLTIGPSAILSLLTYQYAGEGHPEIAALLSFLTGIVELLFGVLQLGFIIDFVSMPVISGYTSAAAILVAASQIKGLLGLTIDTTGFASTIYQTILNIRNVNTFDAILGLANLAILLGIKALKDSKMLSGNKVMFYISTAKNALVVLCSSLIAYGFHTYDSVPFHLTGNITGGLPEIKVPSFSFEKDDQLYSFTDVISKMGLGITTITCIAIISNIVVAKVFTKSKTLDASQEITALGVTNLLGSFIGAMPVCGSFSRSAVNNGSGVRTTLGGVFTALLVLLALAVFTPYFYFIPRAALSAVVISAVLSMVDHEIVLPMWKSNRKDLIPTAGTFFLSLAFGIELGLIFGMGIDLLFLLYYSSRPSFSFDKAEINSQSYWIITPRNGLMFPAGNYLQKTITTEANKLEKAEATIFVLNLIHVSCIDFTAGQVMKSVVADVKAQYKDCITLNARKSIIRQLENTIPGLQHATSLESQHFEVERV